MRTKQEIIRAIRELDVLTISVEEAGIALGVSRSTAFNAYRKTGFLTQGVPVLHIGKRRVVSTYALQTALGLGSDANASSPMTGGSDAPC